MNSQYINTALELKDFVFEHTPAEVLKECLIKGCIEITIWGDVSKFRPRSRYNPPENPEVHDWNMCRSGETPDPTNETFEWGLTEACEERLKIMIFENEVEK